MAKLLASVLMSIPFLVAIILAAPTTTASSPSPTTASPTAAVANSSTPSLADASPATPTAYDMLAQYNLARGVLPEGVTGYVLRPDGSFEVYLPGDCNLRAGGMNVRYSSVIKGNIQTGSISDLQGVNVEVIVWIGITQVDASDGQLHFVAGPISKSFPVDKFASSPHCQETEAAAMAKNCNLFLFLIVFSVAVVYAGAATGNSTTPTAYDMLERYNLPRGILPEGVQRYELRPDGSFEVFLSGSGGCELLLAHQYKLRYDQRIAGTVQAGLIRGLEGVSVKVLFVWLSVTEVRRAGDHLSFLVGPLTASFPLHKFAHSPRCLNSRTGDAFAAS
ncbi:hypothetical protein EJB05_28503, partial [Eragrostis curvula]